MQAEGNKSISTVIKIGLLIGNGESIQDSINKVVNEIKNVPQINVERIELNIDVNRTYQYTD
ncbi:hypothetical protein CKN61_03185 [Carnobacterium divergens]|uniref:hypothetical protein n=1 Tax=Carnobacterium divergens TaxID=2748 RepID=UPI001072F368|nr:hypothetical protein [Carnobacterium divergens]TFI93063.1 hypothetical protein CKN61_03185 [Carnobacterium divergens]